MAFSSFHAESTILSFRHKEHTLTAFVFPFRGHSTPQCGNTIKFNIIPNVFDLTYHCNPNTTYLLFIKSGVITSSDIYYNTCFSSKIRVISMKSWPVYTYIMNPWSSECRQVCLRTQHRQSSSILILIQRGWASTSAELPRQVLHFSLHLTVTVYIGFVIPQIPASWNVLTLFSVIVVKTLVCIITQKAVNV